MQHCDYCGGMLTHANMFLHSSAFGKAFCSMECCYAWQVRTLKTYNARDPHEYENRKNSRQHS